MAPKRNRPLAVFDQASLAQVSTAVAAPDPVVGQPPISLESTKGMPEVSVEFETENGLRGIRVLRGGRVVSERLMLKGEVIQ